MYGLGVVPTIISGSRRSQSNGRDQSFLRRDNDKKQASRMCSFDYKGLNIKRMRRAICGCLPKFLHKRGDSHTLQRHEAIAAFEEQKLLELLELDRSLYTIEETSEEESSQSSTELVAKI